MYEDVRIEMAVRRIALNWDLTNEDRVASFVYLFNNEGEDQKENIKKLIAKYSPEDWEIFEESDRKQKIESLERAYQDSEISDPHAEKNESLTLEDILRKIGKVR